MAQSDLSTSRPVEAPPLNLLQPTRQRRVLLLKVLLGVGAIAALVYCYHWWRYASIHMETDDAYVTGHINPVNARISGTVTKVLVNDNQIVSEGDLLVKLDPTTTKLLYSKLKRR